jgi:hypothetical protein
MPAERAEAGSIDFENETGIVVSRLGDEVRLAFYDEDLGCDGYYVDLQPWALTELRELLDRAAVPGVSG